MMMDEDNRDNAEEELTGPVVDGEDEEAEGGDGEAEEGAETM